MVQGLYYHKKNGSSITKNHDPKMCKKIIDFLRSKKNKQDQLDGILLNIFPQEIDKTSKKILQNLGYLISHGIVEEFENFDGRRLFKIIDDDHSQNI